MEECGQVSPASGARVSIPGDPNLPTVLQDLSGQLGAMDLNACQENPRNWSHSTQRPAFAEAGRNDEPSIEIEEGTFSIDVSVPRPGNTKIALLKLSDDRSRERITCGQPFCIHLNNCEVVCWLNKTVLKELCSANFHPTMSQHKLAKLLSDHLSVDIDVRDVEVIKMSELGHKMLRDVEPSCLATCIRELLPKELRDSVQIRLHLNSPESKVEGLVHCKDNVAAWEAAKFLESKEILLDCSFAPHIQLPILIIETKVKIVFGFPSSFFLTIEKWFSWLFPMKSVEPKATKSGDLVSLQLRGSNLGGIVEAVQVLNRFLRGEKIVDPSWPVSLEQVAETVKEAVSRNKVYMYCKPGKIHLIGGARDIQDIEKKLGDCIKANEECKRKKLALVTEEFSMLRSFSAAYGANLFDLVEECELSSIEFDPNMKSIEVGGTDSAIEKAEKLLCALPKPKFKSTLRASGNSCPVCGLPSPNGLSLQSCGHWHCIQCLLLAVTAAPLPLTCFIKTCGKPWLPEDINQVVKNMPTLHKEYARRCAYFGITANTSSQGQICPVPECDFVWSSEICSEIHRGGAFRRGPICPKCRNAVCLKCCSLFHYGMSCGAFMECLRSPEATKSEPTRRESQGKSPEPEVVQASSSLEWAGFWKASGERNEKLPLLPAEVFRLGETVYKMTRKPRGLCIIINNREFRRNLPCRLGSEVDVELMARLFEDLYFTVQRHNNLTADEMKAVFSQVTKDEQQKSAECFVMIIMSIGENDRIYGVDAEVLSLEKDIYPLFNKINCPALEGKPKLFLIQGSRDFVDDCYRKRACNAKDYETIHNGGRSREWFASPSDLYIALSTSPGSYSIRDTFYGSLFINSVYKVFNNHAWELPLRKLLARVKEEVKQNSRKEGHEQTPWLCECGETIELYFNPGCHL